MYKNLSSPSSGARYFHNENDMIGMGSSAKVYIGTSKTTKQKVAIKTIYKPRCEKKLYKTEIKVLELLNNCPWTVSIIDNFQTEQHVYMILEWCENGSLRNIIEGSPNSKLDEETAIKYLHGVVEGLFHMHSKGIMHRDLKPENILFKGDQLKLTDFGIASLESKANDFYGTSEYLAPEIYLLDGEDVFYDKRVDIWSLGILFHEMLFGSTPCGGDRKAREKIYAEGYQVPEEDTSVSNDSKELLKQMLKVNPEERISLERIREQLIPKKEFISMMSTVDVLDEKFAKENNPEITEVEFKGEINEEDELITKENFPGILEVDLNDLEEKDGLTISKAKYVGIIEVEFNEEDIIITKENLDERLAQYSLLFKENEELEIIDEEYDIIDIVI